jgi:hypothetical protein
MAGVKARMFVGFFGTTEVVPGYQALQARWQVSDWQEHLAHMSSDSAPLRSEASRQASP